MKTIINNDVCLGFSQDLAESFIVGLELVIIVKLRLILFKSP
jgi:hypothetical protein